MRITGGLSLAFVMGMACAACSGSPSSSTTNAAGQPTWQINVKSTTISNQGGKVLVTEMRQEGQSTVLGGSCTVIESNSFAMGTAALRAVGPSLKCDLVGDGTRFDSGRYTLTSNIYTQANFQTAEITTTQSVVVNDHTTVTVDGGALSRAQPTITNLQILPATLPTLTVGVPVSITLSVVGGSGKGWVFSPNTTGTQIPGLTVNAAGTLSGTPTTAGPYSRGISVVDSDGNSGSIVYAGTVQPGASPF